MINPSNQEPLLKVKKGNTSLTPEQIAAAKEAFAALNGHAATEHQASGSMKTLEYLAAGLDPVYEGFDTLVTFAWFLNNVLDWGLGATYGAASVAAFCAAVTEGAFVTLPEIERIRGSKFEGPAADGKVEKYVMPILRSVMPLFLLSGCIAGGAKFGMAMCAALTANGQALSELEKMAAFGVAIFRFNKERLVSYERARSTLVDLGFPADHPVYTLLDNLPCLNGFVPGVDIAKIIINNQPVIQGSLHGVAMFQMIKQFTGDENILSDALHDPLHQGWKALLTVYAALYAASGEKTAQEFDIETVRKSVEAQKVQAHLVQLAKAQSLNVSPALEKSVSGGFAKIKSNLGWFFKDVVARYTTTPLLNAVGNIASKAIDIARTLPISPLTYLTPLAPRMSAKLTKVVGQAAYGGVAAAKLTQDSIPGVPNVFASSKGAEIGTYAGLMLTAAFAGLGQWNTRESGALHDITRRDGAVEGDNQPGYTERLRSSLKDTYASAHLGAPEEGSCLGLKKVWNKLICEDDPLTQEVIKQDLKAYASFLIATCDQEEKVNELYTAILAACLEKPELAITIHFMAKVGGDKLLKEAANIQRELQYAVDHMVAQIDESYQTITNLV